MSTKEPLKWGLILLFFLLSIAGAVLNNLVSQDPVGWLGSPPVYPKPEDLN